ncbi:MAG: NAD(P)-binding protein [Aureobasidium pullulans]|nr:MAG: NAD(P)-binding protein [Aureobasidium pullulans]
MPQSLIPRRLFCCFATRSTIRHLPTPSETLPPRRAARMITRFLTSVSTAFSPFNPKSGKTARNFLALLPPNARSTMKIDVKQLSRADADKPGLLALKFKDGKEMNLDLDTLKIKDIMTEVDRHSRMLGRKEELAG